MWLHGQNEMGYRATAEETRHIGYVNQETSFSQTGFTNSINYGWKGWQKICKTLISFLMLTLGLNS